MSDPDVAAVLTAAMDAQLDSERWGEVCDLVAATTGGTAFMVFEYDFSTHKAPFLHGCRTTREKGGALVKAHMEGAAVEDNAGYDLFSRFPAGRMIPEQEVFGLPHDRDLPQNRFRDAVLAASGSKSRSAAKLNDIGPWSDIAALHLPVYGADIPPELRVKVDFLMPVLGKALETGRSIRSLIARYRTLLDAFDLLDFGCALVESDGRIVVANARFSEFSGERDGITATGGFVGATRPDDRAALRGTIAAALDASADPKAALCALSRRSGRLPYVVRGAPIRADRIDRKGGLLALLLVLDPDDEGRVTARGLGALGILTRAELEVCELLVRGFSLTEIAQIRDKSPETIKDQSKSVIAKLVCRSRLDLVRLALATNPPLRDFTGDPPAGG